ncbi:MAG: hypothetical protein ACYCV4_13850 [Dermatophilaceae bacterium]
MDCPPRKAPQGAGMPGLVAAAIIGVHALGCTVFAVLFPLVAAQGANLSTISHVMFSVFTVLFAVGLGLVARDLLAGCELASHSHRRLAGAAPACGVGDVPGGLETARFADPWQCHRRHRGRSGRGQKRPLRLGSDGGNPLEVVQ